MGRNNFIMLPLLCLFIPIFAYAEPVSSLEKANLAYQEGNFPSAISAYETALREGANNGHVHFNLGNAYYRAGKFGNAIAEYRKALLQLPSDPDVRANLNLARERAKDKIDIGERGLGAELLSALPQTSRSLLRRIFLTLYCGSWMAVILWSLFSLPSAKTFGIFGLILSMPLAVLLYGTRPGRDGALEFAFTSQSRALLPAVLVAPETKVYSGDGEGYQVVFLLHEGAEVMTGELRGNWVEVLLPGERKGWLKQEDLVRIMYEEA